ncbi:glycoside hydrolase family 28 protein [Lachnospiraceae bacterium C1.1]|nr:glycoside hydrolase family 28 protein [Lachnospiraceae bacterium C1.1]
MEFEIIEIFNRSVTIEVDSGYKYRSKNSFKVYINGELRAEKKENVVSISSLTPDTVYLITIEDSNKSRCEKSFRTLEESVLLDVTKFGAVADGNYDDTAPIQAAILACPPKGTIYFPRGTYLSRPIFLKSNITLYLDEEAVIMGFPEREKYPILPGMVQRTDESDEYNIASWEGNPLSSFASLITGIEVHDVDIIGGGCIDGNASNGDWWVNPKVKRGAWRPNIVFLCKCHDIRVQNVLITNSPGWTVHPYYSDHLKFMNIIIENPYNSPNTDGFDPESCTDVSLIGSRISVGDDCVAIKSGKYYMSRYHFKRTKGINIRNCFFERGHGSVTIGSEMACGVDGVSVSNCVFKGTDRGIRLKTRRGRGKRGVIDNLRFENIEMADVMMPLTVNMFYYCDPDGHSDYVQDQERYPVDERTPKIGTITVKDVDCTGANASFACCYGLPEQPIEGLEFSNVNVSFLPESELHPVCPIMMDNFPELKGKSFFLKNVKKVILNNVNIQGSIEEAEFINTDVNGEVVYEDSKARAV